MASTQAIPVVDSDQPVAVVEVQVTATELPSRETRVAWFDDWEQATRTAQIAAREDREYYDGKQWDPEEIEKLRQRKQPALIKNRIARKINFIAGREIQARVDPVARPRTPQHEDAARAATDALRYIEEEQKFDKVRSAVLKNVLIEGYGGAVKGVELDDDDGDIKHTLEHVQWDRLFYDPHSRAVDFGDAKYLGIVLWMDLDDAIIRYPDSEAALTHAVNREIGGTSRTTDDTPRNKIGLWVDAKRRRIKIVEMYFFVGKDCFRSDFTQADDLLPPEPTKYLDEKKKHSVCPLRMFSCYVDQDGMRYGIVRNLKSPQQEVNKRASKALHILSTNRTMAERDFILDPQKFQIERGKPDGFAEVEPGGIAEGRVITESGLDLAQGQVMLLQEAKNDIDTIGPSSSNLPELPQGASGRAFIARQQAASMELGTVFDALRDWTLSIFELDWLCVRQFWTQEKWLRVTDDDELTGYRFVAINRQMTRADRFQEILQKDRQSNPVSALNAAAGTFAPQILQDTQSQLQIIQAQAQQLGQQLAPEQIQQQLPALISQHPLMQEIITENQVDQILVDIIVDEAPDTAVIEQEEFEKFTNIMPTLMSARPDKALFLAKQVIRLSQLRNRKEVLQEFEEEQITPEQQQQQQQVQQLQLADLEAGVGVKQSQAQLNQAKAAAESAEAQAKGVKLPAEVSKLEAAAMEAAASAGQKAGGLA